jgi:hypothetical protein
MKSLLKYLSIVLLMMYYGCAGTSQIGSEKTIEKSGSTPNWINTPTSDNGEFMLVTGELTKANDRSFGMNQAYADGVRKLMNTMQNDVKTQSSLALRGANLDEGDIGRFSEFTVAWISDTYKVSAVQNPETYWEKVEVKTLSGVKYNFNCYSLLKISKKDYNKALEGAYNDMKKKAQDENNKKAELTANKLIDELKSK